MAADNETRLNSNDNNPFRTAANVFVTPVETFKTLDAKPTILFPLALLLIS